MSKITFSQAMQGDLLAIEARHLSEHTVKDYVNTFNKLTAFPGDDIPIEDITHKDIEAFFSVDLGYARTPGPPPRGSQCHTTQTTRARKCSLHLTLLKKMLYHLH